MRQQKAVKDSAETFVYHVSNGFGIPQHFAKDYNFCFVTVETTYSTYNTLEWVKRKTIYLLIITLFWFLCVSLL